MNDRIAELRARLDYEGTLDDMDIEHLLDCAEALKEIIEPISYMKSRLKAGERLNGAAALQLAGDVEYLRGIARNALARLNGDDHAG